MWARIFAVAVLVTAHQMLAPLGGSAQVDPCTPVPIPELCDGTVPIPGGSPTPSPSPTGGPKGGPKGDPKGGDEGQDSQDKGGDKTKGGGKKDEGLPSGEPPKPSGVLTVSSPNNSVAVVEALTPLERYGMPLRDALLRVVGPFPVAGLAYWNDDWHACRDGCTRFHEGLDIFGKEGVPLVATTDGVVTQKLVGDTSGISVEIEDANGVQYFYAHLSAWAEPIEVGDQVHVGQVVGYLGHTGNAIYTPPHVHLEVQPGGVPVPPKPFVDKWVRLAELRAQQLVAEVTGQPLPEGSDFRITRLFDLAGGGEILDAGAERLLALAGVQPSVSSLEVARQLLGQMAYEIDWAEQTDPELLQLAQVGVAEADLANASPWSPFGAPSPAPVPGGDTATLSEPEQGD